MKISLSFGMNLWIFDVYKIFDKVQQIKFLLTVAITWTVIYC